MGSGLPTLWTFIGPSGVHSAADTMLGRDGAHFVETLCYKRRDPLLHGRAGPSLVPADTMFGRDFCYYSELSQVDTVFGVLAIIVQLNCHRSAWLTLSY